jgi:hypothetical protein
LWKRAHLCHVNLVFFMTGELTTSHIQRRQTGLLDLCVLLFSYRTPKQMKTSLCRRCSRTSFSAAGARAKGGEVPESSQGDAGQSAICGSSSMLHRDLDLLPKNSLLVCR